MANVIQFTPKVAISISQKLKVVRAELEPVAEAVSFVMGWALDKAAPAAHKIPEVA